MNKDDLEDQGLLEVCTNCGSLNLKEYGDSIEESKRIVCGDCGTVDFTHLVSETEYLINNKIKKDE